MSTIDNLLDQMAQQSDPLRWAKTRMADIAKMPGGDISHFWAQLRQTGVSAEQIIALQEELFRPQHKEVDDSYDYPFLENIDPKITAEWLNRWRESSATAGGRSWAAWDFIAAYADLENEDDAIPGLLPRGEVMTIVGETGTGKSWLHVRMAVERATGNPVLDTYDCETGDVLCCLIEGKQGWARRLRAHLETFKVGRDVCRIYVRDNLPELIKARGYGVKVAGGLEWFLQIRADQHCNRLPNGLTVVFIDYLREASLGASENSNDDMALVMQAANQLARALNVGIVLFHHQGANSEKVGRGATVIRDMSYSMFLLEGNVNRGAEDPARLRCDKAPKDHPAPATVNITLDTEKPGYPILVYAGEKNIGKSLATTMYEFIRERPKQTWGRADLEKGLIQPDGVPDATWMRRIKVAYDRIRDPDYRAEYPGIVYEKRGIRFVQRDVEDYHDR